MKLFLRPSQNSAHRIACKALYRALLEQCPRVQHLAEGWPATPLTFKHLIRKQFKRNKAVDSPRLVVAALKAGYEAEALVRLAGDGDENATAKVMSVLEEIERIRLLSRANAAISPKKEVVKRPLPAPYPGIKPMLEMRPRPKEELGGTGIRKVPRFIQAGGFPMLRFSKRHSPFLSRVIKQKVLREDSIHKRLEAQESMMKMGEDEDLWDDLVKRQWRNEISRDSGMEGSSWKNEMQTQMKRDRAIINEENRKTRATAKKMLDVVRKEEELAARERMDRKRGRKGEKDRKRWRENLGLKGR